MRLYYMWLRWNGNPMHDYTGKNLLHYPPHGGRDRYAEFLRVERTNMHKRHVLIPGKSWLHRNSDDGHTHISWVSP